MLKRMIFFLSLALLSNVLWGDEFKVRILSCPKAVPFSAPVQITAEVINVSGRSITVAYGHDGFTVSLGIRRSDGKPLPPYAGPVAQWSDNFQMETVPADWQQVKTLDAVPLPVENCELVVQAVLASHGPYFHYNNGEKSPFEAWNGEVKSEEVRVQIIEPSGADKEAYDYFKGSPLSKPQDLLSKFPSSTYAGYVVYETSGAKGLMASDPATVAQAIVEGSFLNSGSVPDDTGKCKDGWQSLTVDGLIKWREKWFGIVLKNHPDIWFADALRLKLAVDQIALKNCQAGAADLETLSKQAKPDVAQKAQTILDAMEQKGWIKS